MNTEKQNKISYFFIDENDLFINKYEKFYDNSFSTFVKFWDVYTKIKKIIEKLKRNPNLSIEDFGISHIDLENYFTNEQIPNKYQKFIIAIPNNSSDGYELTTKSEFDLTSFEKININGKTFAFGKNIEHGDLYTCFELKSITEDEAINFRNELMEKNIFDSYKSIANNIFKEKNLIRKQVRI